MRFAVASLIAAALQVAPVVGVVVTETITYTYGPCAEVLYTPTTAVVPVTKTVSVAYPSTLTLTAVDWSLTQDGGTYFTTVESWTATEDPHLTTTTKVGTLQCTTTPTDFIVTEPTVVATSTNLASTVTVTAYKGTPVTVTATETITYFGRR